MHEWLENNVNSDCKGREYLYTLTLIIPPDLLLRIMINYHVLRDKQTLHRVISWLINFPLTFLLSLSQFNISLAKERIGGKENIRLHFEYIGNVFILSKIVRVTMGGDNWHEYLPLSVSVARFHLDRFDWYSKATGAEFLGFRSASFRAANLTLATFRPICHEWKSSCSQQFARTE